MQICNFIWLQHDLSTYSNGIWYGTNSKLRLSGLPLNKYYPRKDEAAAKKEPGKQLLKRPVMDTQPKQLDESLCTKPVLRVVNHVDGFRTLTTKTRILQTLKNYYANLKDLDKQVEPVLEPSGSNYQS